MVFQTPSVYEQYFKNKPQESPLNYNNKQSNKCTSTAVKDRITC